MYKFRVTNLTINKELSVALKAIHGLGWHKVSFILARLGISNLFFVNELNEYYKDILFFYLESFILSIARIDRFISLSIRKLTDLGTYRGIRLENNLPVHGQRTRTNANTQRSKRRKKEELDKLGEKNRKS